MCNLCVCVCACAYTQERGGIWGYGRYIPLGPGKTSYFRGDELN